MAWQTPKTNWTSSEGVTHTDLNRIEENISVHDHASDAPQIPTAGIADLAVTVAKLAGGITAAKLASDSVTTSKIADGQVTSRKVNLGNDSAGASADKTLSGSFQVITGAQLTVTPAVAGTCLVWGYFTFVNLANAISICEGRLYLDGVATGQSAWFTSNFNGATGSVAMGWRLSMSAGEKGLSLRAKVSGTGAAAKAHVDTKLMCVLV